MFDKLKDFWNDHGDHFVHDDGSYRKQFKSTRATIAYDCGQLALDFLIWLMKLVFTCLDTAVRAAQWCVTHWRTIITIIVCFALAILLIYLRKGAIEVLKVAKDIADIVALIYTDITKGIKLVVKYAVIAFDDVLDGINDMIGKIDDVLGGGLGGVTHAFGGLRRDIRRRSSDSPIPKISFHVSPPNLHFPAETGDTIFGPKFGDAMEIPDLCENYDTVYVVSVYFLRDLFNDHICPFVRWSYFSKILFVPLNAILGPWAYWNAEPFPYIAGANCERPPDATVCIALGAGYLLEGIMFCIVVCILVYLGWPLIYYLGDTIYRLIFVYAAELWHFAMREIHNLEKKSVPPKDVVDRLRKTINILYEDNITYYDEFEDAVKQKEKNPDIENS